MRKRVAKLNVIALIGCMAFGLRLFGAVQGAEAASANKPGPTVFGPATLLPDDMVRVSAFNASDRTMQCAIEVRDAITGQFIDDDGRANCNGISPRTGCSRDFDPPGSEDRLALIIIVCVSEDGTAEGIKAQSTRPMPLTLVSVEIVEQITGAVRLLLPAVQAAR